MSSDPTNFSDPGLKAALRRTLGGERAPAGLRDRVAAALAAEAAGQAPPAVAGKIGPSFAYRRVAAVIIALLGMGLLAFQLYREYGPRGGPVSHETLATNLIPDMVKRHDASLNDPNLTPTVAAADFDAIGKKLSSDLGKKVVSMPLGENWSFRGGTICMVGNTKSAQLLFARGQTTVSLMSVPTGVGYTPPNGKKYDDKVSDHLIAGVVYNQVAYCLIAQSKDQSLTVQELQALRDKIAAMFASSDSSCAPDSDTTAIAGNKG
jgi:hypothetical protein